MARRAMSNGVMAVLVVGTLLCFGAAAWDARRMHMLSDAPAFRIPVDFSAPGVYRATVHEAFAGGCRRILRLQVTPGVDAGPELDAAMKGVEGEIVAADRHGQQFYRDDLWWSGSHWGRYGTISAYEMYPHESGTYVVTIRVTKAAVGMAAKRQEVVGEYDFCEVESLPMIIKAAGGLGLGALVGLILISGWVSRWLSKRAARAQSGFEVMVERRD